METETVNSIKYLIGDATEPQGEGFKVVVHICNSIGGWGAGFVMALSKKWKQPEKKYREWYAKKKSSIGRPFGLGEIDLVKVENDIIICNLIGQEDIASRANVPPIRYDAVEKGLEALSNILQKHKGSSVHGPRFGSGLAGGTWDKIEAIIIKTLIEKGISVTIYDLKDQQNN